MNYAKYFKFQQKVLLRRLSCDDDLQSAEAISATVIACYDTEMELSLLHPSNKVLSEQGVYLSEQTLVIMSEYFGLGVKMTGRVTGNATKGVVRITPSHDLELFSRRAYPRSNVLARLGYARCNSSLDSCRRQWRQAAEQFAAGRRRPSSKIELVTINLSAGGVCLPLSPPVINGDLFLLFLELNNCRITAWALAEVVWSKALETGQQSTGLRFVEIMVNDQIAINAFVVEELKRQGCEVDWALTKADSLHVMEY